MTVADGQTLAGAKESLAHRPATSASTTEVAIIGAGPYGLSLAAHLAGRGVAFRIFGTPMTFWREHMPKGMHLKSEGFASDLYDPQSLLTLRDYCKAQNTAYADQGWPVPLELFCAYGLAFQRRFVPQLEQCEVTLLQQANAYRTLANLGRWSPLRLTRDDPREAPRQVIDPGAAWIVDDILADASARANTFGVDSALRLPFWAAAKTGTSKAMRDNWCLGFTDRYTVAVWVGNLEGDPMRAVSGTAGAAPVWRDLMLALHARTPGHAPPRPANVVPARVTFAMGHEPSRTEWFLAGTQQSLFAPAPALAERPQIINPVSGAVYAVDPDIPPARQSIGVTIKGNPALLLLKLDGRALPLAGETVQVPLIPGSHLLTLADTAGRMLDQVRFTVR